MRWCWRWMSQARLGQPLNGSTRRHIARGRTGPQRSRRQLGSTWVGRGTAPHPAHDDPTGAVLRRRWHGTAPVGASGASRDASPTRGALVARYVRSVQVVLLARYALGRQRGTGVRHPRQVVVGAEGLSQAARRNEFVSWPGGHRSGAGMPAAPVSLSRHHKMWG